MAAIWKFFESVGTFFTASDFIPWFDHDIVVVHERLVARAEKRSSDVLKSDMNMMLLLHLVHSKQPQDVQRGIAMLEDEHLNLNLDGSYHLTSFPGTRDPRMMEKMYLLAVGYYRSGDYSRSRHQADRCLEIIPEWGEAISLKKSIEDRSKKDGIICGIGIAMAVGLAAAQFLKK